jgi:porphobilinogen synthase
MRRAAWSRRLVAEHRLSSADLILPVFICPGDGRSEMVPSMPGVERHSADRLLNVVEQALEFGIPAIALFP